MDERDGHRHMLFLVLQIVFMSSFAIQIKYYQATHRDLFVIGAMNYTAAAVLAAFWVLYKGSFKIDTATWITGTQCGIAYVVSYFFLISSVKSNGLSITWSVVRLSVLVPILFSIFY